LIERCRVLIYSLLGERAHSCRELLGFRNGQTRAHNISVTLLADLLCMFDAREAFVMRHKMYFIESQMGSDPCENLFGELAAVAGYNPTAKVARESLQRVEDELACRINPRNKLKPRKKRKRPHTALLQMQRRVEWNSGQGCPSLGRCSHSFCCCCTVFMVVFHYSYSTIAHGGSRI
jgi:hypothetical protein